MWFSTHGRESARRGEPAAPRSSRSTSRDRDRDRDRVSDRDSAATPSPPRAEKRGRRGGEGDGECSKGDDRNRSPEMTPSSSCLGDEAGVATALCSAASDGEGTANDGLTRQPGKLDSLTLSS
jgi:hypothetical protein